MLKLRKNGIRWFLDDCPGLAPMVASILEEPDSRRSYSVRDCCEKKVFIKYFLERGMAAWIRNRIMPRGKKEYDLGKRLLALSVATPLPLGYGVGKGGSFVVEELIEGETFKTVFDGAGRRERLVGALALFLKGIAAAGVRHNDLHLNNILVSKEEKLYLIDLHKSCIRGGGFSHKDEVKNLIQGLTMIYNEMTEEAKARFFEGYGRPDLRPAVEAGLRAQWKVWIDSKKKRAFSTTSKLTVKGRRVFVKGREGKASGSFVETIKDDRKVRVERYSDHIRKIYRGRRRLVRAWENWAALEYVTLDIVPRPIFVEKPFLFGGGFVAMEDLKGQGEELDRFLDRRYDSMDRGQRRRFIDGLAGFFAELLKMGILQKDLKGCNVFVLSDSFRLLDVEDIAFFAPDEEDLVTLFAQLNNSLPVRIATADRMRFFLKLMRPFSFERKRLFRRAKERRANEEIVYEGVSGLKRESWQGRRPDFPAPSSRHIR